MRIGRCRYFGIEEQGLWALLLVVAVVPIACAFGAGAGDPPQMAMTQLHDGTLLAKK